MRALEKLAEMPRGEKEAALPAIKALLDLVEGCRIARHNRTQAAQSKRLVRWACLDCKATLSGFSETGDSLERRCKSPYRPLKEKRESLPPGQICGGRMQVIHDEARSDAGPLERWRDEPEFVKKARLEDWAERSGAA